jgi:hypothetical protein
VIDGDLHLQPRPARRHARAFSRLGVRLGAYREPEACIVPFEAVPLDVPSLVEGVAPKP